MGRLASWFEDRSGFGEWWSSLRRPAPWSAAFAAATAVLLVNQAATGALLAAYYKPTVGGAYASTELILYELSLGWLVRSLHLWGQHLVVLALILWLAVTITKGAYARPRELSWAALVALFFAVMLGGQTGQVLPLDEHGFSGAQVAASMAGPAESMVLGGRGVTDYTLGRFFAAHVFYLPVLWVGAFFAWRTFASRKPEAAGGTLLERVGIAALLTFGVLLALAVVIPLGLGPKGSALVASATAKPHWYLLPAYQALKWIDSMTATAAVTVAALFLFVIPWVPRKVAVAGALVLFLAAGALGVMGALA